MWIIPVGPLCPLVSYGICIMKNPACGKFRGGKGKGKLIFTFPTPSLKVIAPGAFYHQGQTNPSTHFSSLPVSFHLRNPLAPVIEIALLCIMSCGVKLSLIVSLLMGTKVYSYFSVSVYQLCPIRITIKQVFISKRKNIIPLCLPQDGM